VIVSRPSFHRFIAIMNMNTLKNRIKLLYSINLSRAYEVIIPESHHY